LVSANARLDGAGFGDRARLALRAAAGGAPLMPLLCCKPEEITCQFDHSTTAS